MPPPQQKRDWSSFAASLIPAVVGGIGGGPMGAAAGFGKGMGDISTQRMEEEKYQREQEMKEAAAQRQQEEVDISRRYAKTAEKRLTFEESKQEVRNRQIEQQMEYQEVQMEQLGLEVGEATRSAEARQQYRTTLSEQERVIFDVDTPGYMARREELIRLKGSGPILESVVTGIPAGQGQMLAEGLGSQGLSRVYAAHVTAKANPTKGFTFVPAPGAGGGFMVNLITGETKWHKFEGSDATKSDLQLASQIHDDAFQDVSAPYKGPMGQINLGDVKPEQFHASIDARAREMAAQRGRPDLFAKDATLMLADALADRSIRSEFDAIVFLLSRGVPEPQVGDIARDLIRKQLAAELKGQPPKPRTPAPTPGRKRPLKELWAEEPAR